MNHLPEPFQALEAHLMKLQARFQQGELDANTYQAEIQNLKVEDVAGRTWWLGGERSAWHLWDGSAWIRADPPLVAQARVAEIAERTRRPVRPFTLGCLVGSLIVIVLGAIVIIAGWQVYLQEPRIVQGANSQSVFTHQYDLASDQAGVVHQMGYPEAFSILFYEEVQEDGTLVDIRFETWSYFSAGYEYTFINGDQTLEESLGADIQGDLIPLGYKPEQFIAYMSLDELIASTGTEQYLIVPLEKELVNGGEVYYTDGLTFGLKGEELMYVEAIALEDGE